MRFRQNFTESLWNDGRLGVILLFDRTRFTTEELRPSEDKIAELLTINERNKGKNV